MKKKLVNYELAKHLLREGDVLLFSGSSIFSFFIKRAGEGKYSHAAVASKHQINGHFIWECVEFREWAGGRTISLEVCCKDNPGIDVYRVSPKNISLSYDDKTGEVNRKVVDFDGKKVTASMRKMTGLPYGYRRIFWIAQHKIPILRMFYSIDSIVDDNTKKELVYPVCSTAVAHSYSKAGFDLVANKSDHWTEPSDLSRSTLLNYLFTIK